MALISNTWLILVTNLAYTSNGSSSIDTYQYSSRKLSKLYNNSLYGNNIIYTSNGSSSIDTYQYSSRKLSKKLNTSITSQIAPKQVIFSWG